MNDLKIKEYDFDAGGQILGRLASRVTSILRGKHVPGFLPNKVADYKVTVYNTDQLKFTGDKLEGKKYYWHSGYPGGIRSRTLKDFMIKDSREVFRMAVYGMLPKNKLRSRFIKNLRIFKGQPR